MKKKLLNRYNIFFWLFSSILFILALFFWWAVGEQLPRFSELEIPEQNGENGPIKDEIIVVSYNIGHGQGIKERAWDYRSKDVTVKHLNLLSEKIKEMDADVYLLQEVDLASHRTQNIDQIAYIKEKTGYPFHACAIVWQKNYIPFPYWPMSDHIGYIRAANCVLSKYKISDHQRIIFNKPKSNPWWYNIAYIDRGVERVNISIGDKKIAFLNTHLEAWDISAREEQIKIIARYIKEIKFPIILAGDFNTITQEDPIKNGFADEPEADYSKEQTFNWLFSKIPSLKYPHIKEVYTFPSNAPTRRLDHIFLLGDNLQFESFRVVDEAKTASDHLPVMAKIKI